MTASETTAGHGTGTSGATVPGGTTAVLPGSSDPAATPPGNSGVAWHRGDPLREQRVLTTAAGLVDRSHRDVLTVTGPDRLTWLHSICSQHLSGLGDGEAAEALVLSPHGHVEQHWQVSELAGTVWLDTEPGAAPDVLAYLTKMRFLSRVEIADVSADWSVLSLVGPESPAVLARAGLPVPGPGRVAPLGTVHKKHDDTDGAGPAAGPTGSVRAMAWPGPSAFDLLVPSTGPHGRDAVTARLQAAGAAPAGLWAFEALRVAERRPRLGFETDHRTIPHEVGWIGSAVHLNKGCYRGQETVARVQNLGRPPRRLVLLHLSGDSEELPPPGAPVVLNDRTVGFLGTAVHHYELGPIALAVIKRSLPDDAPLTVDGDPVAVDPG